MSERHKNAIWIGLAVSATLLGLYLRVGNLGQIQQFTGDQGRDYLAVMNWLKLGRWPLLGPERLISHDFSIGPGWYYTIAPALAIAGFHPAAGAAFVGLLGTLAALLGGGWVYRTSGSRAAAAAAALLLLFSSGWIHLDRRLWNPNILPFATAALACLIEALPRRPVRTLALALMLAALLPQWHTTGILIVMAALPCLAAAAWRARPAWREATVREWLGWGGALAVLVLLLYVPPLVEEFKAGGAGNLSHFFTHTTIPAAPEAGPLPRRMLGALQRLESAVLGQYAIAAPDPPAPAARTWPAALFLGVFVLYAAGLRRGKVPRSVYFFTLLLGGYWLVLLLKGQSVLFYYLRPVLAAPVLLAGWMAGCWLKSGHPLPAARRAARLAGLAALLAGLGLAAAQLPAAWRLPRQGDGKSRALTNNRKMARFIARDAGPHPYSLLKLQSGGDFTAHYLYLAWYYGKKPLNTDRYAETQALRREEWGERIYLIASADGKTRRAIAWAGFSGPAKPSGRFRDSAVYCIPARLLPAGARELRLGSTDGHWTVTAR